jgi:hypothetical protein
MFAWIKSKLFTFLSRGVSFYYIKQITNRSINRSFIVNLTMNERLISFTDYLPINRPSRTQLFLHRALPRRILSSQI